MNEQTEVPSTEIKSLHVFTTGEEFIIAYDVDDAIVILEEYWGNKLEKEEKEEFYQMSDDNEFTFTSEEVLEVDQYPANAEITRRGEFEIAYKATCKDWAAGHGRGYFASTEY